MNQPIYVVTSYELSYISQFIERLSLDVKPLLISTFEQNEQLSSKVKDVFFVPFDTLEKKLARCSCCVPSNQWISTFAKIISYNENIEDVLPVVVALDPRVNLKRWLTLMRSSERLKHYFEIKSLSTVLRGDEENLPESYLEQLIYIEFCYLLQSATEEWKKRLIYYQPLLEFDCANQQTISRTMKHFQQRANLSLPTSLEIVYYQNSSIPSVDLLERWIEKLTYTYGDQIKMFSIYFQSSTFPQGLFIKGNHQYYNYKIVEKQYDNDILQGVVMGVDIEDERVFLSLER